MRRATAVLSVLLVIGLVPVAYGQGWRWGGGRGDFGWSGHGRGGDFGLPPGFWGPKSWAPPGEDWGSGWQEGRGRHVPWSRQWFGGEGRGWDGQGDQGWWQGETWEEGGQQDETWDGGGWQDQVGEGTPPSWDEETGWDEGDGGSRRGDRPPQRDPGEWDSVWDK